VWWGTIVGVEPATLVIACAHLRSVRVEQLSEDGLQLLLTG
jgi:hypothetical protein